MSIRWRTVKAVLTATALALLLVGCGAKPTATPTPAADPGIPLPEVPRISVEEAAAHYEAGTALFVDVRAEQYYAQGHIPNSVSLPLTSIESNWNTLPPARLIITVCT